VYYLFIDSTLGLNVGLLNSQFNWVEYLSFDSKKPSEIIHSEIFNLLNRHQLNLKSLECFATSGPGSYTGMRLSEGLVQVLSLSGIKIYSFYHFEVPKFSGIKEGFWATNAFKGQIFVYEWNSSSEEKHLFNKDSFEIQNNKLGFTLDNSESDFSSLASSRKIIRDNPSQIFSHVYSKKMRVPPYYFRTLDEEFR
jgi:tRNA threonylcarbamoyladenosine biosynthesis protein TsaB